MGFANDRIVVVTGASRGAGKGIALALGQPGTTVYVTGRTELEGDAPLPGTVAATAAEITARGGVGVPVICDHADDAAVERLFSRVASDHGRLDILVNNALAVPDELALRGPFWEKPLSMQKILDVGMRSTYVASWYAAPLLVANGAGLIVNTSSFGARCYMHGPAYGAGKAAVDKMAHDMALDLKPFDVAAISLWMGMLKTERTAAAIGGNVEAYKQFAAHAESAEFPGLVIDALARDPKLMARTGQVLIGAEVALELGVTDIDGNQPPSHRGFLGDPTIFSDAVVQ
ncbi:SDR family NAD(P)-dependent oxidoreductase [Tomitella biformata]|uniref:SDR family NAD(P)-dependent oxidoreductase n=1 Tax=Tomitella biformata TaxID=630403 RepID=UPI0004631C6E|nr:SDR family NAD(P)-dependent oxidoreductase [Tomitella biformata]